MIVAERKPIEINEFTIERQCGREYIKLLDAKVKGYDAFRNLCLYRDPEQHEVSLKLHI